MAKVRVYELAKELGVESKTVLTMLKDMGEFVRSASSTVEAPVERRLKEKLASEPPPAKKTAKKAAPAKVAEAPAAAEPAPAAVAPTVEAPAPPRVEVPPTTPTDSAAPEAPARPRRAGRRAPQPDPLRTPSPRPGAPTAAGPGADGSRRAGDR